MEKQDWSKYTLSFCCSKGIARAWVFPYMGISPITGLGHTQVIIVILTTAATFLHIECRGAGHCNKALCELCHLILRRKPLRISAASPFYRCGNCDLEQWWLVQRCTTENRQGQDIGLEPLKPEHTLFTLLYPLLYLLLCLCSYLDPLYWWETSYCKREALGVCVYLKSLRNRCWGLMHLEMFLESNNNSSSCLSGK